MPAALRAALEALEEREQELRATEAARDAVREAVAEAHQRDVNAIAAARESGKPDPRASHEVEGSWQASLRLPSATSR